MSIKVEPYQVEDPGPLWPDASPGVQLIIIARRVAGELGMELKSINVSGTSVWTGESVSLDIYTPDRE